MSDHPLHPSVRNRLDPEYVKFHEQYLNMPPPKEWDPSIRSQKSPISFADRSVVPVGSSIDLKIANNLLITALLPEAKQQGNALPTLLWFHGGMSKPNPHS